MKFKYFIVIVLFNLQSIHAEIWLFRQEFIRFGKKSAYEELKKEWNRSYRDFFKEESELYPILSIESFDTSEYIYLVPVFSYPGVESFKEKISNFEKALSHYEKKAFSSTLNFYLESLETYLPECSYIPEFINPSFCNMPYVHYHLFSITVGNEKTFEERLMKKVFEEQMKKSNCCWRVWKVAFGGDLPKYVVCQFFRTREGVEEEEIFFISQNLKEIVRRHREGKGILRRDLSVLMTCDP